MTIDQMLRAARANVERLIPMLTSPKQPKQKRWKLAEVMIEALDAVKSGKVRFLQIGGNDGGVGDPIARFVHNRQWEGIVLEPVPAYFELLCQTYKNNHRVTCLNIAIGERDGERTMYAVDAAVAAEHRARTGKLFMQGIASFDKQHLLRNGAVEDHIESIVVKTATGRSLISSSNLRDIDLLLVDVEGAENLVLSTFDWSTWRPKLVIFESKHMHLEARATTEAMLSGYKVYWAKRDSVAILQQ